MRAPLLCWALLLLSCGHTAASHPLACGAGRTELDGVCVSEAIADYVSCVRAQGAQLSSDQSQKLSAEARHLGVKVAGAAELRDTLEKRYSMSPENEREILRECSRIVAQHPAPPSAALPAPTAPAAPPPTAPSVSQTLSQGLLGRWTFDEGSGTTARDAVSGADLALDPGLAWGEGRLGQGLLTPGGTSAARSQKSGPHADRELTIALWIRQRKPGPGVLVFKGTQPDFHNSQNREYVLWVRPGGAIEVGFVTEAVAGKQGFYLYTAEGVVTPGRWMHVIATISRASLTTTIWVDGEQKAIFSGFDPSGSAIRPLEAPLWLGNGFGGAVGFDGAIDDLRIYSRTLTPNERSALTRAPP